MRAYLFIFFFILFLHCKPEKSAKNLNVTYIFDLDKRLSELRNSNDTLEKVYFETSKTIQRYVDTFLVAENYKYYSLVHYYKLNNYQDTSFVKHKSFMDSIVYFDNKWLENEESLDKFWSPVKCWACGDINDTTKIYLVRPLENSDSLIFIQVHRSYHETQ